MVSLGAMGDSYYEYLLKVWIYKGRRAEDDMYRGRLLPPGRFRSGCCVGMGSSLGKAWAVAADDKEASYLPSCGA